MNFDSLDMARLRGLAGNKWNRYGDDVLARLGGRHGFSTGGSYSRLRFSHVPRATGDLGYPFSESVRNRWRKSSPRAPCGATAGSVDSERVELMIDVVQGLYLALDIYCEPGERSDHPNACLSLLPYLCRGGKRPARHRSARWFRTTTRFVIDIDAVEASIDDKGTRVLMVCNPHNPTGRVFLREELRGTRGCRATP